MPAEPTREEELFHEALELPPGPQRSAFLRKACGGDEMLRQGMEALLRAHAEAGIVLEPVVPRPFPEPTIAPVTEKPGDQIVRYKLLQMIGGGGFGIVYMAEQQEPVRRRVALKIIKLGMDTRQVVTRFEAERQALAMMDYPNIAKVFDAGATETGRPFFVMELVRGVPITEHCDQNRLSTRQRLELFILVCKAIQHAHQKGVIHRDIKPSNILVTLHDGVPVPKIIDFGIAKAIDQPMTERTLLTRFGQFMGTPAYMSPEQAEISGLDVDARTDIYSLGVLLYELLTSKPPFDPDQLVKSGLDEMRRIIREQDPPKPSTRLATFSDADLTIVAKLRGVESRKPSSLVNGDLDWVVMKALEKDRARRYNTANDFAMDIERHLQNEPIIARPPSNLYRFQKLVRRNKLAVAVIVTLLLGLTVSSWQMVAARNARNAERLQRLQAQSAQKVAETERERADGQARNAFESQKQSRRLLYTSDMNLAQQSLKQNNLGWARELLDRHRPRPGEEDLRGWEWRYLWQQARSTALVTLTNRLVRGWSASFSPDGTRLAVGWFDGRQDLWDVPSRRFLRALTERKDITPGHVAFSPIRNLLAATSGPKTVTLYDLDSGRESILWLAPDNREGRGVNNMTFSHDGPEPNNLMVTSDQMGVHDLAFSQDGSKVVICAKSDTQNPHDAVWVVDVSSAKIESRHSSDDSFSGLHGAARLSPDNQRLYLQHSDGVTTATSGYSIQCRDVITDQRIWQSERLLDDGLTALAISPDGLVLASGSGFRDPSIRLWDAATGRLLVRLEGHTSWVRKLVFTKDGHRLVSASADQTIRFWDMATWTEAKVLRGHRDEVHAVAVSETGHIIASASKDGDLTLWNDDGEQASDGYLRLPETLGIHQVGQLDGSRVLLFPDDKPQEVFDLGRRSPIGALPQLGPWTNMWFGNPGWLCRWDGTNQILVLKWSGSQFLHCGGVTNLDSGARPTSVVFNPARKLVAWSEAGVSNSVFLATLASPEPRIELKSEIDGLQPIRFSDNGNYLATVDPQMTALRVWNVDSRQTAVTQREQIRDFAFADGGQVLVTLVLLPQSDHEIRFYDLNQPDRVLRRVPGRYVPVQLAVSPDGRLVAATTEGNTVRLCDAVTGELIEDLHGAVNSGGGVSFSPDGHRLISAAIGGLEPLKLWDVDTRQELLSLSGTASVQRSPGSGFMLRSASWSSNGDTILVSAPWQAWHAPSWEEIAAAEAKERAKSR